MEKKPAVTDVELSSTYAAVLIYTQRPSKLLHLNPRATSSLSRVLTPSVYDFRRIKAFSVEKHSSAYWLGDCSRGNTKFPEIV